MSPYHLRLMLDLRVGVITNHLRRLMAEHAAIWAAGAVPSDAALRAINERIRASMDRFHFFSDLRNLMIRVQLEEGLPS